MGLLFLLATTAAAWVYLGPWAAGIAFLSVALVRVALRMRVLELENEELKRRLSSEASSADAADLEALQLELFGANPPEGPPQSGTRPSSNGLEAQRRLSNEG